MTTAALILFSTAVALASAYQKRWPNYVLVDWLQRCHGRCIWLRKRVWPAIRREREHYAYCLDEARRATR